MLFVLQADQNDDQDYNMVSDRKLPDQDEEASKMTSPQHSLSSIHGG